MKRITLTLVVALFVLVSIDAVNAQNRARQVVVAPNPRQQSQPLIVSAERTPIYIDVHRFLQNQIGVESYVEEYLNANVPQLDTVAERAEAEKVLEVIQIMPDSVTQNGINPKQSVYNDVIRQVQNEVYYRTGFRSRWGYTVGNVAVGALRGFERSPYYSDTTVKVDIVVRIVSLNTKDRVVQKRGTDIYTLRQVQSPDGRQITNLIGGGDLTEIGLDPKTDLTGFERYFLGLLSLKRQLDLMPFNKID